jgi:hypothetical protein
VPVGFFSGVICLLSTEQERWVSFPARFVFAADSCAAPALLGLPARFSFCPFVRLCASPGSRSALPIDKESVFRLSFCCSDPDAGGLVSFCSNSVFRLVVLYSATKISFASCSCCAGTDLQWWICCLDLVLVALLLLGDSRGERLSQFILPPAQARRRRGSNY